MTAACGPMLEVLEDTVDHKSKNDKTDNGSVHQPKQRKHPEARALHSQQR